MPARFEIIGRATRDTEITTLPSGTIKANMSLAVNKGNDTYYFNIIAFNNKATLCNEYVKKGKLVYVDGSINPRSYEKDGVKHNVTDYILQNIEFLSGGSQNNEQNPDDVPF
jgi:single-strand DNA-binding protein